MFRHGDHRGARLVGLLGVSDCWRFSVYSASFAARGVQQGGRRVSCSRRDAVAGAGFTKAGGLVVAATSALAKGPCEEVCGASRVREEHIPVGTLRRSQAEVRVSTGFQAFKPDIMRTVDLWD